MVLAVLLSNKRSSKTLLHPKQVRQPEMGNNGKYAHTAMDAPDRQAPLRTLKDGFRAPNLVPALP